MSLENSVEGQQRRKTKKKYLSTVQSNDLNGIKMTGVVVKYNTKDNLKRKQ